MSSAKKAAILFSGNESPSTDSEHTQDINFNISGLIDSWPLGRAGPPVGVPLII